MKALTIKQPWASLIVEGIKDIENRTWRTNFRGRIYVHAAQTNVLKVISKMDDQQLKLTSSHELDLHYSAIIGEVDIIDCVLNHESVWAEQMEYYKCEETGINILAKGQPYVWNWVLANPVKYDQPILNVKGKLSFWEFNPQVR